MCWKGRAFCYERNETDGTPRAPKAYRTRSQQAGHRVGENTEKALAGAAAAQSRHCVGADALRGCAENRGDSAATDDSLLNGDLGKLSFVSSIFPEASLVFGESGGKLTMPVEAASVVHAWSQSEPFISWDAQTKIVTSAMSGEVIGVYHGNEDERLVQGLGADGLSCLYGNLASVTVSTGDMVQTGDPLGTLLDGQPCVMEVRQDGLSVDPAVMMRQ